MVVGGCLRAALRALGPLVAALPPLASARADAAKALLEAAEGDLWSPAPIRGDFFWRLVLGGFRIVDIIEHKDSAGRGIFCSLWDWGPFPPFQNAHTRAKLPAPLSTFASSTCVKYRNFMGS